MCTRSGGGESQDFSIKLCALGAWSFIPFIRLKKGYFVNCVFSLSNLSGLVNPHAEFCAREISSRMPNFLRCLTTYFSIFSQKYFLYSILIFLESPPPPCAPPLSVMGILGILHPLMKLGAGCFLFTPPPVRKHRGGLPMALTCHKSGVFEDGGGRTPGWSGWWPFTRCPVGFPPETENTRKHFFGLPPNPPPPLSSQELKKAPGSGFTTPLPCQSTPSSFPRSRCPLPPL